MERRNTTVTISKSSPSIIAIPSDIKTRKKGQKIVPEAQLAESYKRNIIPNRERSSSIQRKPYSIIDKGRNLTPKSLQDPAYPSASEKLYMGLPATKPLHSTTRSGAKLRQSPSSSSFHSVTSRFSVTITKRSRGSVVPSIQSFNIGSIGRFSATSFNLSQSEDEVEIELKEVDRAPSMFRLREDPSPRMKVIPKVFTVTLAESETMFLLEIQTIAEYLESEAGQAILKTNKLYETAIQTSKSISHIATQTTIIFQKHRRLFISRNQRANGSAWATIWDIYDTCSDQNRRASIESRTAREEGRVEQIQITHDDEASYNYEFEFEGYKFNVRFLNALMLMERLIEKKYYIQKQQLYQGLLLEDPLSVDIRCNYTLTYLWTFSSDHTKNRKVTSMCCSPVNNNILAVGYGKFKYTDKCKGLVCIWNVKNPRCPERHFPFEDPVTFVNFSEFRTHILAISFYSGLIVLVDIISRSLLYKANNRSYPLYYPVWQVRWFPNDENLSAQFLVSCGKNGRVFRYKKTKFFTSKRIMSMGRPHGTIQGVSQPRKCFSRKTLSSRHPSAEVLVHHPQDPLIYLVGTSEGYVYVCSVNHRHDHIDVFVAHNGPVYTIQFNPFCHKVFLTCGADWCIRIWAETILEPLITLESGMTAVQDALWNPLNSTIIVSISGTTIEVWDIRRKIVTPKSRTESPTNSFNTVIQFTENCFNLCVGDADGNVHVMGLAEMPFSPSFQEEVLVQAIKNVLISQPELMDKLRRLGQPFASEESNFKTKLYRKLDHLHKKV